MEKVAQERPVVFAVYGINRYNLPIDWMVKVKSLTTSGKTFRSIVITGKATAPPPTLVIPPMVAPATITRQTGQRLGKSGNQL